MINPLWLKIPAKWAHDWAPLLLAAYQQLPERDIPVAKSFEWNGLEFDNPIGIAGGLDKDADFVRAWWRMGVGFVEIGTVTPQAQNGNPGIVIDRDTELKALWNKMGFPSAGAKEVKANLDLVFEERKTPIFVNIGKNRSTKLESASEDYVYLIHQLHSVADVFVVNISSPNTEGLRKLQSKTYLETFLEPIISEASKYKKPVLLKVSPDNSQLDLEIVLRTAHRLGISGFVLTNTTSMRTPEMKFSTEGGVSGQPLAELSKQCLAWAHEILGADRKDLLLVSAGGILTPDDAVARIQSGADLLQVYSALVFYGPTYFSDACQRILR
jgi:dihydroorotate dehydrogenase